MAEIWMYFHKAKDTVRCNGCAHETPNTRESPAHGDALWTHLSSAHRDVYERSTHYATLGSPNVNKVYKSPSNLPSEIWSFFEKVGGGRVRCMLCSREITHKKGGRTSDLWQHLKSRHVEAFQTTDYAKARTEVSAAFTTQATSPRLTSEVWTHFTRISTSRVKCNACSRELLRAGSSTGDLWDHLRALHSDVFKTTGRPKPMSLNATNKRHFDPEDPSPSLPPVKRRRPASNVTCDAFYETLKESFVRMNPGKVQETKATILDVVKAALIDE